jgi:RNA polymerase sigma factor (sigma-70 family)
MDVSLDALADRFAAHRRRLVALAARLLGTVAEAEDMVQDAWLRLARADAGAIEDLGGWLSTVVTRAAIDRLRQRRRRGETPIGDEGGLVLDLADPARDPEAQAVFADAVGIALVVVLDRLGPAERLAFMLHDVFGLPFDEVGAVVGRSPAAARQLASRARRRVQGTPKDGHALSDVWSRAEVVAAFVAAARGGRLEDLVHILDPAVTLTTDALLLSPGAPGVVRGADVVASRARGGAQAAVPMLVDGAPGLVVAPSGRLRLVLAFKVERGRVVAIEAIAAPDRLAGLDLRLLPEAVEEDALAEDEP